jgi:hypothetical protein
VSAINIVLDDDYRVTQPNLGDTELRELRFVNSDVFARFLDPMTNVNYEFQFYEVGYLFLSTNHMQNVVDRVYIFQDSAQFRTRYEQNPWFEGVFALTSRFVYATGRQIVCVEPVAGPTMFATCASLTLSVQRG